MSENQCVLCGQSIPEGRQVCPECVERNTVKAGEYPFKQGLLYVNADEMMGYRYIVHNTEYRPCLISGKKALFHKWCDWSDVVEPSPLVGGYGGGVVRDTFALVEFEGGIVRFVEASRVKFCDNPFADYDFHSKEVRD